ADAQFVARTTRFHPIGRRPVDSGNTDGAFCNIDPAEYLAQANSDRFVIVQIEDPEPMDELDAIAQVEGIDMLLFGPGDFSHGIGVFGQWDHPRIAEARKLVVEAALRHGKFAGTLGSPDHVNELVDMGYRFISITADVVALSEHCKTVINEFNQALAKRAT
ncbi:HpcH/HpaI aldolase/citrate lyase family protein, partial [Verrucomicrobiota bacterium]